MHQSLKDLNYSKNKYAHTHTQLSREKTLEANK
jgi:hypothetical protein